MIEEPFRGAPVPAAVNVNDDLRYIERQVGPGCGFGLVGRVCPRVGVMEVEHELISTWKRLYDYGSKQMNTDAQELSWFGMSTTTVIEVKRVFMRVDQCVELAPAIERHGSYKAGASSTHSARFATTHALEIFAACEQS